MMALDGMQPTFRQVPPRRGSPFGSAYGFDSQQAAAPAAKAALEVLQKQALANGNVFASLMDAAKICSLGQMSAALYRVGGQYRRNM